MRHRFDPASRRPAPGELRRSAWARAANDVPNAYPRRVEDSVSLLVPHGGLTALEARQEAARRMAARRHAARERDQEPSLGHSILVGVVGVLCGAALAQGIVSGIAALAGLLK